MEKTETLCIRLSEISLSMINELAKVLGMTSTYLLGYNIKTEPNGLNFMADVMGFLFELEKIADLKFDIDVKCRPRNTEWECSTEICTFHSKSRKFAKILDLLYNV